MAMGIVLDFLQLGMIYGIVTLALVISFRIIGFADLTIEGSFSLGGAVAAVSLYADLDPVTAVLLAILAGGAAGFFTAVRNGRFTAAAVCFSEAEYKRFKYPDPRPKWWFRVNNKDLFEVCPEAEAWINKAKEQEEVAHAKRG